MTQAHDMLESLLQLPESDVLEFKIAPTPDVVARTVVSFLNAHGGTMVIGMSEKEGFIGIEGAPRRRDELESYLLSNIAPEATLRIEVVEKAGRQGILIEVPPGAAKPYVVGGAIYVRRGEATVAATPGDITRLVGQRAREEERWERLMAVGVEPEALSLDELNRTVEAAHRRYTLPLELDATLVMKLERLDLAVGGWPRNAAVVLFLGEKNRGRYPQLAAHATVFQDEERRNLVDDQVYTGNAFELFHHLLQFIMLRAPVRSTIHSDATVRQDAPAIPMPVAREAILNAITHREYRDTSPIQLRLFPNRLELWNPGSIPQELINQPGVSRPRNPDIARILYLRGYVEMLGVGMLRMRDEMEALNRPLPQWENRSGGVLLTLPFTEDAARSAENAALEPEMRALSERAFAYLNRAKPGERITREEYQSRYAADVAERSARNDLRRLVQFGYLRQVGAASKTAYIRTVKTPPQFR